MIRARVRLDNQCKSAIPDKTSSPSSASSDKSASKTPDNQSNSALPNKTSSPSSASSDKSASKTPDNQGKSALPDKTSSPSSTSSDKSASKKLILCRVGVLFPCARDIYSPKVLVIPRNRWLRLNMTEKLLTRTLNKNQNKTKIRS